jgi:cytochrome subunit of sulfide dehydrogenase
MNREITRWRALLWLPVALASSCVAAQTTTAPPAGRLLASNCFQCHGYDGKSSIGFERLSGESSNEIYNELREMRSKSKPDIMDMHARGYTDAQMRLIADYLATQKSTSRTTAATDKKSKNTNEKRESKS